MLPGWFPTPWFKGPPTLAVSARSRCLCSQSVDLAYNKGDSVGSAASK